MSDWKTAAAEELARRWNEAGCVYAVANGVEEYPASVGRDLDVLAAPGDLGRMVDVILVAAEERGWTAVVQRLGWIYWIMLGAETAEGRKSFQVDLFDHLQWGFTWLLDGRHLDGRRQAGPFWVDAWSALAKRLLINVLSTGGRVLEVKPHYFAADEEQRACLGGNLRRLSGRDWPELERALAERDLPVFLRETAGLRKGLLRHALASGDRWWARMASAWQKQWAVNLWPRRGAPVIAVNGRPGGAYEAVLARFSERMRAEWVYCRQVEEEPAEGMTGKGAWQWLRWFWVAEYRGVRRDSALQTVRVYRNHACGMFLFPEVNGGRQLPAWLVAGVPQPDLRLVLADKLQSNDKLDSCRARGLVDAVVWLTGDVEHDVEGLARAVMEWHRQKAAKQKELWAKGRI